MHQFLQLSLVASLAALPLALGCSSQSISESGVGGAISTNPGPPNDGVGEASVVGSGGAPDALWSRHFGDLADQEISAIAVAPDGAVVVAGSAAGTIDFDDGPRSGGADTDVVVARLGPSGKGEWSRRYGDSCDQHGAAVALAPSGDVIVAGDLCGTMTVAGTKITAAAGDTDAFVTRLDSNGYPYFTRQLGGAGEQRARAAAVNAAGDAIIVGSFQGAFDAGAGKTPSAGADDAFVIALDPLGKVLWSRTFGGAEADVARAVAVNAEGEVIVVGSFGGSVDLGGAPLTAAPGQTSAFVVALDAAGKVLWSRGFGDPVAAELADVEAQGVAVNGDGDIAVTGSFTLRADFGAGPMPSAGSSDVFVTKLDATGTTLWARVYGGKGPETGTGVAFDPTGNLALVGDGEGLVDFGMGHVDGVADPTGKSKLAFEIELDTLGGLTSGGWPLYGVGVKHAAAVGRSGDGGVFVAGAFEGTILTPSGQITAQGGQDAFVLRLR